MKSCFHEALVKENKGFTNHPIPRRYGYVLDVEWQHWSRWGRSHVFSCQSRAEKRWREHSMQSLVSTLKNCMGILSTISKKKPVRTWWCFVYHFMKWLGLLKSQKKIPWDWWCKCWWTTLLVNINHSVQTTSSLPASLETEIPQFPNLNSVFFCDALIWTTNLLPCRKWYDCALTWEMEVASI